MCSSVIRVFPGRSITAVISYRSLPATMCMPGNRFCRYRTVTMSRESPPRFCTRAAISRNSRWESLLSGELLFDSDAGDNFRS